MMVEIGFLCLEAYGAALWAADLSIDMRVNTGAKDYANNYLTFKGKAVSVDKDQYAPGATDATSGVS
jgi:hypothetical protein